MANLIGKSSVDWKNTADLTGQWRLLQVDEESFLKFFEARGSAEPKARLQFYKNAAQHEIIDKGDSVIFNFPDPSAEGGRRELDLTLGQKWLGVACSGITTKVFATREGNKLMLEAADHTAIYELQGDKMSFDMKHHGTGITAKMVLMRKSRADSEDGKSG